MKTSFQKYICLMLLFAASSCITIPKQAPALSEEIGTRIIKIEQSHIKLLNVFFDEKRAQVEQFVTDTWIPTFAENTFNNPTVSDTWNQIVASNNKADRLRFIVLMGTKIQVKIDSKRKDLLQPLNDLEETLEQKIEAEYTNIKGANNAITSFLYSASKVEENRNRYLEMAGISQHKINNVISSVDEIVGKVTTAGETVLQKEQQAEEYLKKLKELKDELLKN